MTLFDSVSLYDDLEVTSAAQDEVVCDGVDGPNLVSDALGALRGAGWAAPPLRVTITKRIPVAAGMGGGSADAAALLRLAPRLAPVHSDAVAAIASGLGADVPGQLAPGPLLGTGAGETLAPAPELAPYGVLALPQAFPLATPDVYREADPHGPAADRRRAAVGTRAKLAASFAPELIVNDLQPPALSLAPGIGDVAEAALRAGADDAIVCGSGPTVIGLFWGVDGPARAREAAAGLRGAHAAAVAAEPIRGGDGLAAANE